jgi:hypothetical protein
VARFEYVVGRITLKRGSEGSSPPGCHPDQAVSC